MLSATRLRHWLAEELHRQEPGVAAEGSVLTAVGANTVVDLRDVGCDVLYACVVKAVDPQTWVPALHLALEIVEGPRRMLHGGGKNIFLKLSKIFSLNVFKERIFCSCQNYLTELSLFFTWAGGRVESEHFFPITKTREEMSWCAVSQLQKKHAI